MEKKYLIISIIIMVCFIIGVIVFIMTNNITENQMALESNANYSENILQSSNNPIEQPLIKLKLKSKTSKKFIYNFIYNEKTYTAIYTSDNWKIIDSYQITDEDIILKICQLLIDIHPIHGNDMKSFRTAEDMAYEWQQHNLAYNILPENSKWKNHAKDVDLDPKDQNKNILEIFKDRIK